ncbi:SLATT domain-containing protein [Actinosynnema sp. NPDC059797]
MLSFWAVLIDSGLGRSPLVRLVARVVTGLKPDLSGSVAEPSEEHDLRSLIKLLEKRSYKTYQARLKAHQRLSRRNNAWNASLVSLATSTTIASVGLLVNKNMYGTGGDTLMVALAILSLVASLVVSSINYGARARAMEASYKRIQQISFAAERFLDRETDEAHRRFLELHKEYEIAIDSSENHSDADHLRASGASFRNVWRDTLVSFMPYITLAVPAALLVPFAIWFANGI